MDSGSRNDRYHYVYSCELIADLQIKVVELDGYFRDAADPLRKLNQVLVEAEVFCNGRSIGYPISTSYRALDAKDPSRPTLIHVWKEWITFPVKYSDLSRDAFVHFTVWDMDMDDASPPLTTAKAQKLISEGLTGCPKRLIAQTSMPLFDKYGVLQAGVVDLQLEQSKESNPFSKPLDSWKFSTEEGKGHFLGVLSKKDQILRGDADYWLNQFSAETIEKLQCRLKNESRSMFLVVSMAPCSFDRILYDIVYYEVEANTSRLTTSISSPYRSQNDPELGLENLCEAQHSAMTRTARSGRLDRQLKPNIQAKHKLEMIMKLPSSQPLTREQTDIVWKFRYYLQSNPRALNKFLHSVDWRQAQEVSHAVSMINDWAPIECEDALELLSPAFQHPAVRTYAVSRLRDRAQPELLQLFIPQLVQAIKYEPQPTTDADIVVQADPTISSTDAVEVVEQMAHADIEQPTAVDLPSFLVMSAEAYPKVANYLYWYLKVEIEATAKTDMNVSKVYSKLLDRMMDAMNRGTVATLEQANSLNDQKIFVENLVKLVEKASATHNRRDLREQTLRTLLSKSESMLKLKNLVLPLDPSVRLVNVLPDSTQVFKSAMMPVKLTFKTTENITDGFPEYTLIFKQGDDLRQDQLIIQMIRLMDMIFKKINLDLKLTPYAVLATGLNEGFVQFIKGRTLRDVIKKYEEHKEQCIKEAMKEYRPDSDGPFGIEASVVDNYVRSLAGYSIVCYVLGVGDRHLDNILLCENGKLFHIDFGFILGRDPKPMPPLMKLTSEMINPLGGFDSKQFRDFYQYCDSAYRCLRENGNMLLNLFSLMLDAGIPDIAMEKDKAVNKIEERLKLELSDEEAFKHILSVISSSISARMPVISDIIHDVRQKMAW